MPTIPERATIVFQNGRPCAELFRDPGMPDVEHWVLFPNFVVNAQVETMWIAGAKIYAGGLTEFVARAGSVKGARYLKLDCRTGEWFAA
jgi:hypothetical protein